MWGNSGHAYCILYGQLKHTSGTTLRKFLFPMKRINIDRGTQPSILKAVFVNAYKVTEGPILGDLSLYESVGMAIAVPPFGGFQAKAYGYKIEYLIY